MVTEMYTDISSLWIQLESLYSTRTSATAVVLLSKALNPHLLQESCSVVVLDRSHIRSDYVEEHWLKTPCIC